MACKIIKANDWIGLSSKLSRPLVKLGPTDNVANVIIPLVQEYLKETYGDSYIHNDYTELPAILRELVALASKKNIFLSSSGAQNVAAALNNYENIFKATPIIIEAPSSVVPILSTDEPLEYIRDEEGMITGVLPTLESKDTASWVKGNFANVLQVAFPGLPSLAEDVYADFKRSIYDEAIYSLNPSEGMSPIRLSGQFSFAVESYKNSLLRELNDNRERVNEINKYHGKQLGEFLTSTKGIGYIDTFKKMQTLAYFPLLMKQAFGTSVEYGPEQYDQEGVHPFKDKEKVIKAGEPLGVLSNLASRKFAYKGKYFNTVEHAYQTYRSGKFDGNTHKKFKDAGFVGVSFEGKPAAANHLEILSDIIRESMKSDSFEAINAALLSSVDFVYEENTTPEIKEATLVVLKQLQEEAVKGIGKKMPIHDGPAIYRLKGDTSGKVRKGATDTYGDGFISLNKLSEMHINSTPYLHLISKPGEPLMFGVDNTRTLSKLKVQQTITNPKLNIVQADSTFDDIREAMAVKVKYGHSDPILNAIYYKFFSDEPISIDASDIPMRSFYQIRNDGTTFEDGMVTQTSEAAVAEMYLDDIASSIMSTHAKGLVNFTEQEGVTTLGYASASQREVSFKDVTHTWKEKLRKSTDSLERAISIKESEGNKIMTLSGSSGDIHFVLTPGGGTTTFKLLETDGAVKATDAQLDRLGAALGIRGYYKMFGTTFFEEYSKTYGKDNYINMIGHLAYTLKGNVLKGDEQIDHYRMIGVKPEKLFQILADNRADITNEGIIKVGSRDVPNTSTFFDRIALVVNSMVGVEKAITMKNADGNRVSPFANASPGDKTVRTIENVRKFIASEKPNTETKDTQEILDNEYYHNTVFTKNAMVSGAYTLLSMDEKNSYMGKSHTDLNEMESIEFNIDALFILGAAKKDFKEARFEYMVPSDKTKYYVPNITRGTGLTNSQFMPVVDGKLNIESLKDEYHNGPAQEIRDRSQAMVRKWRKEAYSRGIEIPSTVTNILELRDFIGLNKTKFTGLASWGLTLDYDFDPNTGNIPLVVVDRFRNHQDKPATEAYMNKQFRQFLGNLTSFSGPLANDKREGNSGLNLEYRMGKDASDVIAARFPAEVDEAGTSLWKFGDILREVDGEMKVNPGVEAYYWHHVVISNSLQNLNQGQTTQYGGNGNTEEARATAAYTKSVKRNPSSISAYHHPVLKSVGEHSRKLAKTTKVAYFDDVKIKSAMLSSGKIDEQKVLDGAIFYHEIERIKLLHSYGYDVSAFRESRILKDISSARDIHDGTLTFVKDAAHPITSEMIENSRDNFGDTDIDMEAANRMMLSIPFDFPVRIDYKSKAGDKFQIDPSEPFIDLFGVFTALGGTSNPAIWEDLVEIMFKYPALDGKYVGRLIINSSVKTGATKSNGSLPGVLSNKTPFILSDFDNTHLGLQLNAHHEIDHFEDMLSSITQMNTSVVFEGKSPMEVSAIYDALAMISELTVNRASASQESDAEMVVKKFIEKVEEDGATDSTYNKLNQNFDLNDKQLLRKLYSTSQAEFEKLGVKIKFPGNQYVITPVSNIQKLYEIDGRTMLRKEFKQYMAKTYNEDIDALSREERQVLYMAHQVTQRRLSNGGAVEISTGKSIRLTPEYKAMASAYNALKSERTAATVLAYQTSRIAYNELLSNGNWKVTPSEILLPNSFGEKYGLEKGQSLDEIINNPLFFWGQMNYTGEGKGRIHGYLQGEYSKYRETAEKLEAAQRKAYQKANKTEVGFVPAYIRSFDEVARGIDMTKSYLYAEAIQRHNDFMQSMTGINARIPASGKQSGSNYKVVGFLEDSGNAIGIPFESMLIKGEDLDVDKSNVQFYASDWTGLIYPFFTVDGLNVPGSKLLSLEEASKDKRYANLIDRISSKHHNKNWYINGLKNAVTANMAAVLSNPNNLIERDTQVNTDTITAFKEESQQKMDLSSEDPLSVVYMGAVNRAGVVQVGAEASALKVFGATYNSAQKGIAAGKPMILNIPAAVVKGGVVVFDESQVLTTLANTNYIAKFEQELKAMTSEEGKASIITKLKSERAKHIVQSQAWESYSQLVNAATDNAKELILGVINANSLTSNYINTMIAGGMDLQDLFTVMTSTEMLVLTNYARINKKLSITDIDSELLYSELSESVDQGQTTFYGFNISSFNSVNLTKLQTIVNDAKKSVSEFSFMAKMFGINQGFKNSEFEMFSFTKNLNSALLESWTAPSKKDIPYKDFYDLILGKGNETLGQAQERLLDVAVQYDNQAVKGFQSFNFIKILADNPHYLSQYRALARSQKAINSKVSLPKFHYRVASTIYGKVTDMNYRAIENTTRGFVISDYFENKVKEVVLNGEKFNMEQVFERAKYVAAFPSYIDNLKSRFSENRFIATLSVEGRKHPFSDAQFNYVQSSNVRQISDISIAALTISFEMLPDSVKQELFHYSLLTSAVIPSSYSLENFMGVGVQIDYNKHLGEFAPKLKSGLINSKFEKEIAEFALDTDKSSYTIMKAADFLNPKALTDNTTKARVAVFDAKAKPPRMRYFSRKLVEESTIQEEDQYDGYDPEAASTEKIKVYKEIVPQSGYDGVQILGTFSEVMKGEYVRSFVEGQSLQQVREEATLKMTDYGDPEYMETYEDGQANSVFDMITERLFVGTQETTIVSGTANMETVATLLANGEVKKIECS